MFSLSTACLTFSPFLSSLQQLVGSYPSVSTISSSFPSYYASKTCTYTDAAGRPVPAPRNAHPERPASVATVPGSSQFILRLMVLTTCLSQAQPATETPPWAGQATLSSPPVNPQSVERDPTTKRSRKAQGAPDSSPPLSSKSDASSETFTYTSDPAITHELVNSACSS